MLTHSCLVCSFVAAYDILSSSTDESAIARVQVSGRLQGYSALAVDVFITVSLYFILHGARTGHRPTEDILWKLIAYTVNRGILLFVIQLLAVVTYKSKGNQAMDGIYCFSGTLNVNTAMAALNGRLLLQESSDSPEQSAAQSSLSSFHVRRSPSLSSNRGCSSTAAPKELINAAEETRKEIVD
ncbi:hypothetical protein WOLCODRAFT_146499 [Wolfiporia cocos MD-104 SS10]|uniref:DUF6534 domain-containing protein n=1 Tax=Wolfiporia cocos (strain MD-104) TaxID=742152 RepID=A0A2H3JGY0_WOLCO|nr:hypothetical protein WOLCODRAFT_146499 [Wolfiporia cocos MD-104 SS10]